MGHVMVPCPEEHVDELAAGLLRLQLGMGGWEDDTLQDFLAALGPVEVALVDRVAEVSRDHDRLPYREAAAAVGLDVGELVEVVATVNDRCRRNEWPLPLITDTISDASDRGEVLATPALVIPHHVAVRILGLRATASDSGQDITSP